MSKEMWDLYEFVDDLFLSKKWNPNCKKQQYAVKLYERILAQSRKCLTSLEEDGDYSITLPPLIRSLIEATVDLVNLRFVKGYEHLLDTLSLNEILQFLEYHSRVYKKQITTSDKKLIKLNPRVVERQLDQSKKLALSFLKVNEDKAYKIFKVGYKFGLLKKAPNHKRHERYAMFYDLLCSDSHHNLLFISKEGLKKIVKIDRHKEHYYNLIASILKNGLIHMVNILDKKLHNNDFELLKCLKRQIINYDKETSLIKDLYHDILIMDEYSAKEFV